MSGVYAAQIDAMKALLLATSLFGSGESARIHSPSIAVGAGWTFPLAVISQPEIGYRKVAVGSGWVMRPYGTMTMTIAAADTVPSDLQASETAFLATLSTVITYLAAHSGETIGIDNIEPLDAPMHSPQNEKNPYWMARHLIHFGDDA